MTPKGNMEYLLLQNQIKRFALLFIPSIESLKGRTA